MTERGESGRFIEREPSGQDRAPVVGYGAEIPRLEQQNQPETDKPQKIKIPRRTRGRGRRINPKQA